MMDGLFKQILILLVLVLLIILMLVGYLIVRATTGLR
jgi:hypothetical protein